MREAIIYSVFLNSKVEKIEIWRQVFYRCFGKDTSFSFFNNLQQHAADSVDFIIHFDDGIAIKAADFPKLKAIASPYPYVDHILQHDENWYAQLAQVPVLRVRHPSLMHSAADYVHMRMLYINLHMHHYRLYQKSALWKQHQSGYIQRVGILGMGDIGHAIAKRAQHHDFPVCCWQRQKSEDNPQFHTFTGDDGLMSLLKSCNFIVNCLPRTRTTTGLIDQKKLQKTPLGTCIVNICRGGVIVEEDLLAALNNGHLAHAYLDAFVQEPLPKDHPFWDHPQVHLTPNIAVPYAPPLAAEFIAEDFARILQNSPAHGLIDARLQY